MQLEASLASRSGSTAFRSSSPRLAQAQQQHAHRRERRRAPLTVRAATAPTAYSWESQRLIKVLATRQAIKTLVRGHEAACPSLATHAARERRPARRRPRPGRTSTRSARRPEAIAASIHPLYMTSAPQLRYLGETNGEQHLWLHNYVADTPIPLSGALDRHGHARSERITPAVARRPAAPRRGRSAPAS